MAAYDVARHAVLQDINLLRWVLEQKDAKGVVTILGTIPHPPIILTEDEAEKFLKDIREKTATITAQQLVQFYYSLNQQLYTKPEIGPHKYPDGTWKN